MNLCGSEHASLWGGRRAQSPAYTLSGTGGLLYSYYGLSCMQGFVLPAILTLIL
jgi:hypothetical protein